MIVGRAAAMRFFGCRTDAELRSHLRALKDAGRLLVSKNAGLQHVIRVDTVDGEPGHILGYVVLGRRHEIPRFERPRDPSKGRFVGGRV
jgi:hypothetical protein